MSERNSGRSVKTTLNSQDRLQLHALATTPGYEILLQLMEMECILQDVKVMAVPVDDERKIIAEQRVAVAKWEFFKNIQAQIEYELGELADDNEQGARSEGTEEPASSILSAI